MKASNIYHIAIVILVMMASVSCKESVTEVALNKTTLNLTVGEVETLTASVKPDNANDKSVSWSSSNNNIATVTNGLVTAIAEGSATITVTTTEGNKTANCIVTVTKLAHPAEPEMVFIEGGTFMMGCTGEQEDECTEDERPAHLVRLNNFNISKNLITQKQWTTIMGNNPSLHKGDDLPVERVSWNDIMGFITQLNAVTGKNYRLATEAEWEYAARGGKKSNGYKYSGSNDINLVAWHSGNSNNQTQAVGTKAPNELGIYDMSGNVGEWCSDWIDESYYDYSPEDNPQGPETGTSRIIRSGGAIHDAVLMRVSQRGCAAPTFSYQYIGFRLVHP